MENSFELIPYHEFPPGELISPADNLFYSHGWVSVLSDEYGYDIRVLKKIESKGYMLLAFTDNFAGKKIISLPFCDYTESPLSNEELSSYIEFLSRHYADSQIIIKSAGIQTQAFENKNWILSREAIFHRVPVQDEKTMWSVLSSPFQRGIKKAIKSGIRIGFSSGKEAIERFYKAHTRLRMEKFHSIPQAYSFFERIFDHFISKNKGFVVEAWLGDALTASIVVLLDGNRIFYKFGTSEPEYLDYRPNNLIFWELMQFAIKNKYQDIDLGLTGISEAYEGLRRFKEHMGGIPQPIRTYKWLPANFNKERDAEINGFFSAITGMIVDTGDTALSRKAAELMYKYFA